MERFFYCTDRLRIAPCPFLRLLVFPRVTLLLNTPRADSLQRLLRQVAQFAQVALCTKSKQPELQEKLKTITETPRNRTWSHHWFYNNPTFATLTILNKFELDSRQATLFVLRDVADNLDKQHAR